MPEKVTGLVFQTFNQWVWFATDAVVVAMVYSMTSVVRRGLALIGAV